MNMITNNCFIELTTEEQLVQDGGVVLVPTYTGPVTNRLSFYIVQNIVYNIQCSYINSYNDTVTSNGRTDLVKPYPEKPTW